MKSREILLVVLVVAIALVSGLIGLWLGRSQAQQAMMAPSGPAVSGQEVASAKVRLFGDPQKQNLLYEIDMGRVYQGTVQQGQAILFFDGQRVYRGANTTGEILFTVEGDRIFAGPNTTAPLAYTVNNNRVFEGNSKGPIIYTIEGDRVYRGPNPTGEIVFDSNVNLDGNVRFLLPILADQAFLP
jgi:hypothetical protein